MKHPLHQLRPSLETKILLGACVLLVLLGSMAVPGFLTSKYLLLQTQIAATLGILSLGALAVILIGHIDLSVPWAMTASAMAATYAVGLDSRFPGAAAAAVPVGIATGALIGGMNGFGVAILRVPSMIWTLSVNAVLLGLCVLLSGGAAPRGEATVLMRDMAIGQLMGIPNAALLWVALLLMMAFGLKRTLAGQSIIAFGHGERAAYLSGVSTTSVIFGCFIAAGAMSGLSGLLLAGYANQAYQGMGDPYLLPAIAAIVLSGARLLGGVGSPFQVGIAVLFLTLMTSVLSVFQISAGVKQIIYGCVVLLTLLVYAKLRSSAASAK